MPRRKSTLVSQEEKNSLISQYGEEKGMRKWRALYNRRYRDLPGNREKSRDYQRQYRLDEKQANQLSLEEVREMTYSNVDIQRASTEKTFRMLEKIVKRERGYTFQRADPKTIYNPSEEDSR